MERRSWLPVQRCCQELCNLRMNGYISLESLTSKSQVNVFKTSFDISTLIHRHVKHYHVIRDLHVAGEEVTRYIHYMYRTHIIPIPYI